MSTWPTWWANVVTIVLFVGIMLLVWRVPLSFVMQDAPDASRWRDIRVWAVALILLQFVVYAVFR